MVKVIHLVAGFKAICGANITSANSTYKSDKATCSRCARIIGR